VNLEEAQDFIDRLPNEEVYGADAKKMINKLTD